ncbi:hypothetical protein JZ751_015723, partial [Albula glossodonta]
VFHQGCFIFSLVKYKPLTYNKIYEYPDWSIGVGWTLALASMICIPMVVVIKIIQSDGPLIERGSRQWQLQCGGVRALALQTTGPRAVSWLTL